MSGLEVVGQGSRHGQGHTAEEGGTKGDLESLRVRLDDDSAEQDGGLAEHHIQAQLHH